MLDRTLAGEIGSFVGNDRQSRIDASLKLQAAAEDIAKNGRDNINECVKRHGRAAVAVCIAETLYERADRIGRWGYFWTYDVLGMLAGWTQGLRHRAYINDEQNHPTMICAYAKPLIDLWSE